MNKPCEECINIDPTDGMLRVDGIPCFRVYVKPDGCIMVQFKDKDKLRSSYRGSPFIELSLDCLIEKINNSVV